MWEGRDGVCSQSLAESGRGCCVVKSASEGEAAGRAGAATTDILDCNSSSYLENGLLQIIPN